MKEKVREKEKKETKNEKVKGKRVRDKKESKRGIKGIREEEAENNKKKRRQKKKEIGMTEGRRGMRWTKQGRGASRGARREDTKRD